MATKAELVQQGTELGLNLSIEEKHEDLQSKVTNARAEAERQAAADADSSPTSTDNTPEDTAPTADVAAVVEDAVSDAIDKAAPDTDPIAVASREDNRALEHTQGGTHTRSDTLDAGVDMLQGSGDEPQGPEDAFGEGKKRGDYSDRTHVGPHMESVPIPGGSQPILHPETGAVVDYTPNSVLVAEDVRAEDQGEVPGKKGGVATS